MEKKLLALLLYTAATFFTPHLLAQSLDRSALPKDYFSLIPSERLHESLDSAVFLLETVHPNCYATTPKAAFQQSVSDVRSMLTKPLTRQQFAALLTPLVAGLNCGHTFIYYRSDFAAYRDGGGRLFPLDVDVLDNRLFIKRNYSDNSQLASGLEISAINGITAKKIINDLTRNQSDELAVRKTVSAATTFRREVFNTYQWGAVFTLNVKKYNEAQTMTYSVSGVTNARLSERKKQLDSLESSKIYSYKELPNRIGYLEINGMVSPDNRPAFLTFLKESFGQMKSRGIQSLIIDVRKNAGGDSQTGDCLIDYLTDKPWTQFGKSEVYACDYVKREYGKEKYTAYFGPDAWLAPDDSMIVYDHQPEDDVKPNINPIRFNGKKYLLVSPFTFSSAYSFTTALKAYHIATLVGQEAGGAYGGYGQCYITKLLNADIELWIATKRFFPPFIAGQIAGKALMPDYYVPQTVDDLMQNKDATLDFALHLIAKEGK